jgi:alkylhydroperoxidase/carboxymuconolactone decarboxylase family protein YurZ
MQRMSLLAPVAALAATGREPALAEALRNARRGHMSVRALRETLLQVYLFAGFPRCVNALDLMDETLGPLPPVRPEVLPTGARRRPHLQERGLALFRRVYGSSTPVVLERIGRRHSEFKEWILEDAYGKVLGRGGLTPADRECLAVALLATLDLPRQQVAHVRGALRCGAKAEDVEATIAALEGIAPGHSIDFARRRLAAETEAPTEA